MGGPGAGWAVGGWPEGGGLSRVTRTAFALVVVGLAALPWWGPLVLRPLRYFAVRRVEVEGVRYLAVETVVRALALRAEASVFDDLEVLERRVMRLGGLNTVGVSRRLPGTLRVRVGEIEPVGLVQGPDGLIAVGPDARPLPFDPTASPVDAPVLARADRSVAEGVGQLREADPGLFGEVVSVAARGGELVLELEGGRVRLELPVDPIVVRAVEAVRLDLTARREAWYELDARFRGWVVVRRPVGGVTSARSAA